VIPIYWKNFKSTISVSRPGIGADAVGGETRSYAVVYSGVKACIQEASDTEMEYWLARGVKMATNVFIPTSSGVVAKLGDLIVDQAGNKFEVIDLHNSYGQSYGSQITAKQIV
jgi:hypothetical protein